MLRHPWSLSDFPDYTRGDGILHKVLVHELGHVFGLQHVTSPETWESFDISVMDSEYPELLLSKENPRRIEFKWEVDWIPGFFRSSLGKLGEIYWLIFMRVRRKSLPRFYRLA